jgi:hypothetical protein
MLLVLDAALCILLWFWIAKICAARAARLWWRCTAVALLVVGVAAARQFAPLAMYAVLALLTFPLGMFFIGCAFLVYTLYLLLQNASDRDLLAEATLGVFALVLSVRVLARIVPSGYSIFYDVPLLLVFVIVVTRCIVAAAGDLAKEQQSSLVNVMLTAELLMLAVMIVPAGRQNAALLETRWGNIYIPREDAGTARMILDFMWKQKEQGKRVAVLPDGPSFYAFTGTEAPSRWYSVMPGYLSPEQEDTYISELNRSNPDYIVVTDCDMKDFGVPYFGIDYDKKLFRWIQANYREIGQFGHFGRDGRSDLAGALVLQRRDTSESGHS